MVKIWTILLSSRFWGHFPPQNCILRTLPIVDRVIGAIWSESSLLELQIDTKHVYIPDLETSLISKGKWANFAQNKGFVSGDT